LETMYWPDEIRAAEFETTHTDAKVRPQEVEMAKALIDNLTEPWNPTAYKDEYREALLEIVEKKVAGEEIEVVPEAAPARVVDLMDALKASVEAAKKKTPAARPKAKTGAKKTAAKKTAAPRKKAATG
jgi:DNA end-binding protein Ku